MESIFIFSTALICSLLLTRLVITVATRFKIGSLPDSRKIHVGFIPTLGGLGIFLGTVAGILVSLLWKDYYWQMFSLKYIGITLGALIMLLTGIIDDLYRLTANRKFIAQIVAATVVILFGCKMNVIVNPFGAPVNLGLLSVPLTYLWLLLVTNSINLLDGLDGLAGGVTLVVLATFSILAFNQMDWMTFALCLALLGGILGFLKYNYHPARIFMGDTGSLFLGFLIATISLQGLQKSAGNVSLLIPIVALSVPLGDSTVAFFRRLNRGQHPFVADKDHLHHRLLFLGLSHRQAVHTIYIFSLLFGLSAYLISTDLRVYGIILLAVITLMAMSSLYRLGYLEAEKIKTYLGDQTIIQVKKEMAPLSMRRFWHKFVLMLVDFLTINMTLMLTYWFRFQSGIFVETGTVSLQLYITSGVWLILATYFIFLFYMNDLYHMRWDISRFDQLLRTSRVIIFGAALLFLITLDPSRLFSSSRLTLIFYALLLLLLVNTGRLLVIYFEKRFAVLEYAPHKTILVGAGEKARKILKEIRSNPHLLYYLVGVIDTPEPKTAVGNLSYLGDYEQLPRAIRINGVEEVIIAISERSRDEILNIVSYGENMGVSFKLIPEMYDVISGHKTEEMLGHPLIRIFPDQMKSWQWLVKRLIDIIAGLVLFMLCIPFLLLVIFLQVMTGIYPYLRVEDRVGRQGKLFGLLIFNIGVGQEKFEFFLGRTRLYKIPQLLNLILGSISLVGPRPEAKVNVEELRSRIKFYNRRFMVRPGLTGWAQMKVRDLTSFKHQKEEFKQDLFYLENMSLSFDFRILLRSFLSFIFGK
jgi:UDP-GlcNAc:undecaprenyl-phosphate GlcNAc-1-phosphate transferase